MSDRIIAHAALIAISWVLQNKRLSPREKLARIEGHVRDTLGGWDELPIPAPGYDCEVEP